MTRIPLYKVWPNVVKYYYVKIQHKNPEHSIWSWVEAEYQGKKQYTRYSDTQDVNNYDFVFENDIDATAFKLKFMQQETA